MLNSTLEDNMRYVLMSTSEIIVWLLFFFVMGRTLAVLVRSEEHTSELQSH